MGLILTSVDGHLGRIRLNRPKALHALNHDMCEAMLAALEQWRADPAVHAILIDHAEGRGFCAGGDIRMIAESSGADGADARAFFATEYRLNHRLFTYAKPTIAFMDGVTMGGGVGISQPCKIRVATENSRFAMPETAIGLFPDVGGGWYLSRLPGRIGQYLALTGARLDGNEMLALGLATHLLPADRLDAVKQAIAADPQAAEAILSDHATAPGDAPILAQREAIDRLFASDDFEGILAALEGDGSDWAQAQLATLRQRSPLSCKVSLKLLLDGAAMPTFEDEMRQEYAVVTRIVQRPDIVEGVRAVIVDKDHAPIWDPATPEAVSDHMIDRIFAPLPAADEWRPR
ncbi:MULTISPECIES: enoyl-CoA hydratase/isomerase family protein [unclassified Sphingomonas]|uniref:enoyl-CoA hydratase/isomerase family protein n=1 Tax=unclassified Sphingomonas TaxID=196159 RepID=UPI00070057B2|nr:MULTISPECIES: enoyl-CoA hydratase/isomerase family protein [unclassified Sphingomonas]KQM64100.1 enoyl-CoA hydratase [Sphingomonas sp. Leaf16]KQN13824.1 enoyl-CoA hydratase [Sphingomonas sp. Leaf29]KQN21398.1 enoyl-CoA hydratase [Sphingomonas sp. Leaf32]